MTGRASEQNSAPKAARNGSRVSAAAKSAAGRLRAGGGGALAVVLLGVLAAVLMIAAELSVYRSIEVVTASCEELSRSAGADVTDDCETTGAEQHGWALVPIALLVLLMAWGAGPGRSRPAAAALAFLGVLVLAIVVIGDLPDIDVTGAVGRNFDEAEGQAGPALWLTLGGGLVALGAGGFRLAALRDRFGDPAH